MTLTHGDLVSRVDDPFVLSSTDDGWTGPDLAATLVACVDEQTTNGWVSWSATFTAGPPAPPEQLLVALSAEGLDPVPVLLVPSAATADRVTYEAVFTRPAEEQR